jgi:O-acetyl-ADP-ribose deacetylase (regulator of RNase III)
MKPMTDPMPSTAAAPAAAVLEVAVVDQNADLIALAKRDVPELPGISWAHGDALAGEADAVVTPSNSFGFMNAGMDAAVIARFGPAVEGAVKERIAAYQFGEVLVGQAFMISTGDPKIPHLIFAPVVRAPKPITHPADVLLATRAAVKLAVDAGLRKIVMPCMGAGGGRLVPNASFAAMVGGIQGARFNLPRPANWQEAQVRHFNLNG